ncbi:sugar transferase [Vicingaceae bacterium]|nr:sugar transferase [Vicingaceae bacterium]
MSKKEIRYAFHLGIDEVIKAPHKIHRYIKRIKFLVEYKQHKIKQQRLINISSFQLPLSKRLFDIGIALLALTLLSPVLLITMIALKIESKGPLFYSSKRVGSGYQIFNFYKFRSMNVNADQKLNNFKDLNQYTTSETKKTKLICPDCSPVKNCSSILFIDSEKICENNYLRNKEISEAGTFIKIKNDPRVTKVGKFIRNTSIDELPQLINVLKGDMSIVGNRPLPLYEAELLTSDCWSERFIAPAGITGLWQVEKRGCGEMSEEERKKLDNKYAHSYSFFYDIKLILKTIPALLQSENV